MWFFNDDLVKRYVCDEHALLHRRACEGIEIDARLSPIDRDAGDEDRIAEGSQLAVSEGSSA